MLVISTHNPIYDEICNHFYYANKLQYQCDIDKNIILNCMSSHDYKPLKVILDNIPKSGMVYQDIEFEIAYLALIIYSTSIERNIKRIVKQAIALYGCVNFYKSNAYRSFVNKQYMCYVKNILTLFLICSLLLIITLFVIWIVMNRPN